MRESELDRKPGWKDLFSILCFFAIAIGVPLLAYFAMEALMPAVARLYTEAREGVQELMNM